MSGWRERAKSGHYEPAFRHARYKTIGMGKIYHGHNGDPSTVKLGRMVDINTSEYACRKQRPSNTSTQRQNKGSTHAPPEGPMTELADVPDDAHVDGKRAIRDDPRAVGK